MGADQSPRDDDTGALVRADIAKVETALTEFDKIQAGLADLRTKYAGVVFDVKTATGMKSASTARAEIRAPRYATEAARKAAKAPALALGRNIDERAAFITGELLKIEGPIDSQIGAEEQRKEAEREAREKAERERIARIQAGIEEIKQFPLDAAGKPAAQIAEAMDQLEHFLIDAWEFADVAGAARVKAMNRLATMHAAAVDQEAEGARLAALKADLDRQRAEQAEADRGRVLQEAEARRRIEEEQRASRDRIEQEERAGRARREEADRVVRASLEAEESRLKGERQRLDDERRALEQKARDDQFAKDEAARASRLEEQRKREAEENARADARREEQRKETDRMDARGMLTTFRGRFGEIEEFAAVVREIDAYFESTPESRAAETV